MYKLKPNQPDFECVDGPFAGRKFKAGQAYEEIPKNEAHRFNNEGRGKTDEGRPSSGASRPSSKKEVNDA